MGATHTYRNSLRNIAIFGGSGAVITYGYYKLVEINDILGTDIITSARNQLQNDLSLEETDISKLEEIGNNLSLY